ncbi:hypothetical protein OH77DRAFT_99425 [Trametes cingulata]|nr:hypothetical protein OH77DRAFT_99425 [Trametes cingulata]
MLGSRRRYSCTWTHHRHHHALFPHHSQFTPPPFPFPSYHTVSPPPLPPPHFSTSSRLSPRYASYIDSPFTYCLFRIMHRIHPPLFHHHHHHMSAMFLLASRIRPSIRHAIAACPQHFSPSRSHRCRSLSVCHFVIHYIEARRTSRAKE